MELFQKYDKTEDIIKSLLNKTLNNEIQWYEVWLDNSPLTKNYSTVVDEESGDGSQTHIIKDDNIYSVYVFNTSTFEDTEHFEFKFSFYSNSDCYPFLEKLYKHIEETVPKSKHRKLYLEDFIKQAELLLLRIEDE